MDRTGNPQSPAYRARAGRFLDGALTKGLEGIRTPGHTHQLLRIGADHGGGVQPPRRFGLRIATALAQANTAAPPSFQGRLRQVRRTTGGA